MYFVFFPYYLLNGKVIGENVLKTKHILSRHPSKILIKLDFSRQILEKSLNIKLYENVSRKNRGFPCGRTDVTKLIVAPHNVTNARKN